MQKYDQHGQPQALDSDFSSESASDSDEESAEIDKRLEIEENKKQPDALYEFMVEYERKIHRYEEEKRSKLMARGDMIIPEKTK